MQDWPGRERYTAEDLLQIIRILRDRENGCPWDKVQTHASIRKNFLEETCEAREAIDADDAAMMRAGSISSRSAGRCARSWCSGTRTSLPLRRLKMPV